MLVNVGHREKKSSKKSDFEKNRFLLLNISAEVEVFLLFLTVFFTVGCPPYLTCDGDDDGVEDGDDGDDVVGGRNEFDDSRSPSQD